MSAPKSAAPSRKVAAAAAPKAGTRNSFTSSSGRGARQAWRTNSATSTAPAAIGPYTIGSPNPPWVSLSERPKTMPARPGESSSTPVQSSLPASARPASACSRREPIASATATTGTLT